MLITCMAIGEVILFAATIVWLAVMTTRNVVRSARQNFGDRRKTHVYHTHN